MTPTKHDIIRLIQQGKVKTALEGIVQLSGLARDKEVQQRCLILQSQLSQLEAKFGMGTFDHKTYQLELNRITQAALDLVDLLPAVVAAPHQYNTTTSQRNDRQSDNGSAWKTWGILLTGAVGVMVMLVIVGLMMNNNQQNTQGSLPNTTPNAFNESAGPAQQPAAKPMVSSSIAETEKPVNPNDRFLGAWSGTMAIAGIAVGILKINLDEGNRYSSHAIDPASGAQVGTDTGTWTISSDGLLVLKSSLGAKEIYSIFWSSPGQFIATFVDGTNDEFAGLTISFVRL